MTSQNFIYWLQGYLEVEDPKTITPEKLKVIKAHLRLVFRDEIDPSMGDNEHQSELSELHEGKIDLNEWMQNHTYPMTNIPLERC